MVLDSVCAQRMPDTTSIRIMDNKALLGCVGPSGWRFNLRLQEIMPGLYLGAQPVNEQLPLDTLAEIGIRYVMEVRYDSDLLPARSDLLPSRLNYMYFEINDWETENIIRYFPRAYSFIQEALTKQSKVLVCSSNGNSRSASLVLAYIMEKYKLSLNDALSFVRTKRPSVNPNNGFKAQLHEYEPIYKARQMFTLGGCSSGSGSRSKRKLAEVTENDANRCNCPEHVRPNVEGSTSICVKTR